MESLSPKSKGYLIFIGGILTNFIIGNSMHWLSCVSLYLKDYNNEIQLAYNDIQFENINIHSQKNVQNNRNSYFILCLILIFSNMSNALSPIFTKRKNIRTALFISFFLLICAYSFLYFIKNNYFLIVIAFILYGIGIGLPYQTVIKNIWKYFHSTRKKCCFIILYHFICNKCFFI